MKKYLYKKRKSRYDYSHLIYLFLSWKEIFEQYGGVIITVVAIAALAALVTAIMGNGTSGPVYDAFKNLIDNFGNNIGTP